MLDAYSFLNDVSVIDQRRKQYEPIVSAVAKKYGIPEDVLHGMIKVESNYNPNAISEKGAIGIMQFMPDTAEQFGIDPRNPVQAIDAGARYLRQLLDRYNGNMDLALMAYHAGPGNVDAYLTGRDSGVGPRTLKYPKLVLGGSDSSGGQQEGVVSFKPLSMALAAYLHPMQYSPSTDKLERMAPRTSVVSGANDDAYTFLTGGASGGSATPSGESNDAYSFLTSKPSPKEQQKIDFAAQEDGKGLFDYAKDVAGGAAHIVKRSLGHFFGGLNAIPAFVYGSVTAPYDDFDEWRKLPYWKQALVATSAGLKSAWRSFFREGDWGVEFDDVVKAYTGKSIKEHLPDKYKWLAPTIEVFGSILTDPLLPVGVARHLATSIGRRAIFGELAKNLPEELLPKLEAAKINVEKLASDLSKLKDQEAEEIRRALLKIVEEREKNLKLLEGRTAEELKKWEEWKQGIRDNPPIKTWEPWQKQVVGKPSEAEKITKPTVTGQFGAPGRGPTLDEIIELRKAEEAKQQAGWQPWQKGVVGKPSIAEKISKPVVTPRLSPPKKLTPDELKALNKVAEAYGAPKVKTWEDWRKHVVPKLPSVERIEKPTVTPKLRPHKKLTPEELKTLNKVAEAYGAPKIKTWEEWQKKVVPRISKAERITKPTVTPMLSPPRKLTPEEIAALNKAQVAQGQAPIKTWQPKPSPLEGLGPRGREIPPEARAIIERARAASERKKLAEQAAKAEVARSGVMRTGPTAETAMRRPMPLEYAEIESRLRDLHDDAVEQLADARAGVDIVERPDGSKRGVLRPDLGATIKDVKALIDSGVDSISVRGPSHAEWIAAQRTDKLNKVNDWLKVKSDISSELERNGWKQWEHDKNVWIHSDVGKIEHQKAVEPAPSATAGPQVAEKPRTQKQPWGMTKGEYEDAKFSTELGLSDRETPLYRKYRKAVRDSFIARSDIIGGAPVARAEWSKKLFKLKEDAQKEIDEKFGAGAFYRLTTPHREQVKKALSEGKPVPRRVLEEYKGEKWADEALARIGASADEVGKIKASELGITRKQADAINKIIEARNDGKLDYVPSFYRLKPNDKTIYVKADDGALIDIDENGLSHQRIPFEYARDMLDRHSGTVELIYPRRKTYEEMLAESKVKPTDYDGVYLRGMTGDRTQYKRDNGKWYYFNGKDRYIRITRGSAKRDIPSAAELEEDLRAGRLKKFRSEHPGAKDLRRSTNKEFDDLLTKIEQGRTDYDKSVYDKYYATEKGRKGIEYAEKMAKSAAERKEAERRLAAVARIADDIEKFYEVPEGEDRISWLGNRIREWVRGEVKEPPARVHGLASGKPISGNVVGNGIKPAHIKRAQALANKTGNPIAIVSAYDKGGDPLGAVFVEVPPGTNLLPGNVKRGIIDNMLDIHFPVNTVIDRIIEPTEKASNIITPESIHNVDVSTIRKPWELSWDERGYPSDAESMIKIFYDDMDDGGYLERSMSYYAKALKRLPREELDNVRKWAKIANSETSNAIINEIDSIMGVKGKSGRAKKYEITRQDQIFKIAKRSAKEGFDNYISEHENPDGTVRYYFNGYSVDPKVVERLNDKNLLWFERGDEIYYLHERYQPEGFDRADKGYYAKGFEPKKNILKSESGFIRLPSIRKKIKVDDDILKENPNWKRVHDSITMPEYRRLAGLFSKDAIEKAWHDYQQKITDRFIKVKDLTPRAYQEAATFASYRDVLGLELNELRQALRDVRGNDDVFRDLVMARRDMARAAKPIKKGNMLWEVKNPNDVTYEQAKKAYDEILRTIEKHGLYPKKFEQALDNWNKFTKESILDPLREAGFISDEAYKRILDRNDFYATYEIVKYMPEDVSNAAKLPLASPEYFSKPNQDIIKSITGTTEKTADPLQATLKKLFDARRAIAQNKVASTFIDDLLSNPDSAFKVSFKRVARSPKEKKMLEDLYNKQVMDIDVVLEGTWDKKKYDTIARFKDGKVEKWLVDKEIADVMKRLSPVHAPKLVQATNTVFKNLATSFYPPFVVSNIMRDSLMAFTTSPTYKTRHMFGRYQLDWLKGFIEGLKHEFKPSGSEKVKEYIRRGGGFGYVGTEVRKGKDAVAYVFEGNIKHVVKRPHDLVRKVIEATELAPRLAVYERAKKLGYLPKDAIMLARRSTIDYNRAGELMKLLNEWVPFLNARTQGFTTMWDATMGNLLRGTIRRDPKSLKEAANTFSKIFASIIVPGVMTYAWNRKHYSNLYDDIPPYIKDDNFVFIFGTARDEYGRIVPKYVTIPKGDAGKWFNPVEHFLDRVFSKDPQSAMEFLVDFTSSISPIEFARKGEFSPSRVAASVLPPMAKAVIEQYANKNFYTNLNIEPPWMEEENVPSYLRTNKDVPEVYNYISKKLYEHGIKSVSPLELRNFASNIFAGYGRTGIDPADVLGAVKERIIRTTGGEKERKAFEAIRELEDSYNETRALALEKAQTGNPSVATRMLIEWNRKLPAKLNKLKKYVGADANRLMKEMLFSPQKIRNVLSKRPDTRPPLERRLNRNRMLGGFYYGNNR